MTSRRALSLAAFLLVVASAAPGEPAAGQAAPAAPRFRLFPALDLPALRQALPRIEAVRRESLVRLPGDSDSVFSLGGPAPSGTARFRFAVEVNEAVLKLLAPDPTVHADDVRGRAGGDWKPIDATGRPYQLRLGARLIW